VHLASVTQLNLFFSLARGTFSQRDGFDELKTRLKFLLRGLVRLTETLTLLGYFSRSEALLTFLKNNPGVATKLQRPYLYKDLTLPGKASILSNFYCQLESIFVFDVAARLLNSQDIVLAHIEGREGSMLTIVLSVNRKFPKEGELTLRVVSEQSVALCSLSFSVIKHYGFLQVYVGGLQGPRPRHGHDPVRQATKSMYGLFPKKLVVHALLSVTNALQCESVRAVSNAQHVSRASARKREFAADYDEFFVECGAVLGSDGLFTLPSALPRKLIEDVESKKRSEYRRRLHALDQMHVRIRQSLCHREVR